jgi:hypothetical protein
MSEPKKTSALVGLAVSTLLAGCGGASATAETSAEVEPNAAQDGTGEAEATEATGAEATGEGAAETEGTGLGEVGDDDGDGYAPSGVRG